MITLKDYAKQHNVTYEAIRSQVNRYRDQLGEHIIQDGRQQFLDDYAVDFLDERRQKNPVIIQQLDKDEQIEQLKNNENLLLAKIADQADRIAALERLRADNAEAIAGAKHNQLLLETATRDLESARTAHATDNAAKDLIIQQLQEQLKNEKKRKITLKEWFERRKE